MPPNDLFPPPSMPNYGAVGQEDPVAENSAKVVEGPAFGTVGGAVGSDQVICTGCKHYWGMKMLAPVRNLDVDGNPFTMREGYCKSTGWGLVSLADRAVIECTSFEDKENE